LQKDEISMLKKYNEKLKEDITILENEIKNPNQ
jgi:hypothetical protein